MSESDDDSVVTCQGCHRKVPGSNMQIHLIHCPGVARMMQPPPVPTAEDDTQQQLISTISEEDKDLFFVSLLQTCPELFIKIMSCAAESREGKIRAYSEMIIENLRESSGYCRKEDMTTGDEHFWRCPICWYNGNLNDDKICAECRNPNPNCPLERTPSIEEAERVARECDEAEALKKRQFYCAVCMDEEADIDGSYQLECDHRICVGCLPR